MAIEQSTLECDLDFNAPTPSVFTEDNNTNQSFDYQSFSTTNDWNDFSCLTNLADDNGNNNNNNFVEQQQQTLTTIQQQTIVMDGQHLKNENNDEIFTSSSLSTAITTTTTTMADHFAQQSHQQQQQHEIYIMTDSSFNNQMIQNVSTIYDANFTDISSNHVNIVPFFNNQPNIDSQQQQQPQVFNEEQTIYHYQNYCSQNDDSVESIFDNDDQSSCMADENSNNGDNNLKTNPKKRSRKTSNKTLNMNPNAVAARNIRAAKKIEEEKKDRKINRLEFENSVMKRRFKEMANALIKTQKRCEYLETILAKQPQIMSLIEHMKNLPKFKLNHINLHSNINNHNHNNHNRPNDSSLSVNCNNNNPLPVMGKKRSKLDTDFNNNNNDNHQMNHQNNSNIDMKKTAGICFHIKSDHELSLQFCQNCNNGSSSSSLI